MNEFHFTNEKLNCMIIYCVSDFPTQNLLLNHPSQYVQKRKKETLFLSKGSAPSNPQMKLTSLRNWAKYQIRTPLLSRGQHINPRKEALMGPRNRNSSQLGPSLGDAQTSTCNLSFWCHVSTELSTPVKIEEPIIENHDKARPRG